MNNHRELSDWRERHIGAGEVTAVRRVLRNLRYHWLSVRVRRFIHRLEGWGAEPRIR
jgi:hypothetical protein